MSTLLFTDVLTMRDVVSLSMVQRYKFTPLRQSFTCIFSSFSDFGDCREQTYTGNKAKGERTEHS